ncbi:MAG: hypothetical protein KC438_06545 [Thermomicrobiales bacterium]|nr:hypothetical protein [Thermomicrobiales bacterium]MCO5222795.1 hypothetical protein [Thermomicrobiales bacterium]
MTDVIDSILAGRRTDRIAELRSEKPLLATQMQDYYDSIFSPAADSAAEVSIGDRFLIAIRTASHTGSTAVSDWYAAAAKESGVSAEEIAWARDVGTPWHGQDRRAPMMRHVDLITSRPVDSSKDDIDALLTAGLSPAGIVIASQVVAYVSYQLRLIAALRAMGE